MQRFPIVACLVFSGATALVYQVLWTRLLGFAFGTTTEAVSTVLAVFFGGLALGNALAARGLPRLRRPLRVYALLELAIGAFALLSLPLLRELSHGVAWLASTESQALRTALRVSLAAAILLPPTIAMGATLPVVARGLVALDAARGRWSAILYAANTAGAVLGAYLAGFWLLPGLGLSRAIVLCGVANLVVAAVAFAVGRAHRVGPPSISATAASGAQRRTFFLACFALSGFVAIGYEIVWSKLFGILMEGTIYGFSAVLSSYLLGIAVGSALIAGRVDRIRDLPRAFALLHLGIALAVVVGIAAVPALPFAYQRLAAWAPGDAVHLLYLVVLPIVLVPTALFGAAFPVLIRLLTPRAEDVGRGMGVATAWNTAGSIAASGVVGFWWIPSLGSDATLYLLLLLDVAAALAVLAVCTAAQARLRTTAGAAAAALLVALSYGGVRIEVAIAGRQIHEPSWSGYERTLDEVSQMRTLTIEGHTSIVSVYETPMARLLRTNGMPEAGFHYAPPHFSQESFSLALYPYLAAERTQRALVIGLGGGNTLSSLVRTRVAHIDVVELEPGVLEAVRVMHRGRPNPLDDPRVSLRFDDARDDLLRRGLRGAPRYDLIASQPSHPWRVGAANLFTEDFFEIARGALRPGGLFAVWLNAFRMEPDAFLAVVASFDRVLPGSVLIDVTGGRRHSFLLVGGPQPVALDTGVLARRLREPGLAALAASYAIHGPNDVLASFEGPASVFAALAPDAANTDDNALVETRVPRSLVWKPLDYAALEAKLPADAPLLPAVHGPIDLTGLARTLLAGPSYGRKLDRLLARHPGALAPGVAAELRATRLLRAPETEAQGRALLDALASTGRAQPLRILGRHLAEQGRAREAAAAFGEAFARSEASDDAVAASRALRDLDPEAARDWAKRVPPRDRGRFPDLVLRDAERALAQGSSRAVLERHAAAVTAALATPAGRATPDAHVIAARLAWARGDAASARAHLAADARARRARVVPLLDHASAALDAGELGVAAGLLREAAVAEPGDVRLLGLRARLAVQSRDPAALEAALRALRAAAPDPAAGIAAENRFRHQHGLPLAPEPGIGAG